MIVSYVERDIEPKMLIQIMNVKFHRTEHCRGFADLQAF